MTKRKLKKTIRVMLSLRDMRVVYRQSSLPEPVSREIEAYREVRAEMKRQEQKAGLGYRVPPSKPKRPLTNSDLYLRSPIDLNKASSLEAYKVQLEHIKRQQEYQKRQLEAFRNKRSPLDAVR